MATAKASRVAFSRRAIIKGGLAVGAGLVVGFQLPLSGRNASMAQSDSFAPNQWISIDRDGRVTIINSVVEMGQGSLTTMPAIVADELDTDLGKTSPADAACPIARWWTRPRSCPCLRTPPSRRPTSSATWAR